MFSFFKKKSPPEKPSEEDIWRSVLAEVELIFPIGTKLTLLGKPVIVISHKLWDDEFGKGYGVCVGYWSADGKFAQEKLFLWQAKALLED